MTLEKNLSRQPDVVQQCEEFVKYISYDQVNGVLIYEYNFKLDVQVVQSLVPRDLYIEVFSAKPGSTSLYTSMQPGTPLISILQRESTSSVKIPQMLLNQWADQLVEEYQAHAPANPRLDYVMLNAATGSVYFDIPAYIPAIGFAERFERQTGCQLLAQQGLKCLPRWIFFMKDVQCGAGQTPQALFLEDYVNTMLQPQQPIQPEEKQCKACKNAMMILKHAIDYKGTADTVGGGCGSVKKLFDQWQKYCGVAHSESACLVTKLLQQEPPQLPQQQPKVSKSSFIINAKAYGYVGAKMAYTIAGILGKNVKSCQNALQYFQALELECDLYQIIFGLDRTSLGIQQITKTCFTQDVHNYPELYQSTKIRIEYKNRRDMSQNILLHYGANTVCFAIVREPLDEILKAVQEELKETQVSVPAVLELIREQPPLW